MGDKSVEDSHRRHGTENEPDRPALSADGQCVPTIGRRNINDGLPGYSPAYSAVLRSSIAIGTRRTLCKTAGCLTTRSSGFKT